MSSSPQEAGTAVLRGAGADSATALAHIDLGKLVADRAAGPMAVPGARGWQAVTADDLVEEVRETARAEGYAAGWAQGRKVAAAEAAQHSAAERARAEAAEIERDQRLRETVASLARAATEVEQRVIPSLDQISDVVLAAALVLAEAVVGRELTLSAEPGLDALRRSLDLTPRQRPVVVRMNPDDLASITGVPQAGAPVDIDGRSVTLVPDPSITRGGSVADCDATEVDARIESALGRAREAMGL
jgi:flagellar assembly protein FliH